MFALTMSTCCWWVLIPIHLSARPPCWMLKARLEDKHIDQVLSGIKRWLRLILHTVWWQYIFSVFIYFVYSLNVLLWMSYHTIEFSCSPAAWVRRGYVHTGYGEIIITVDKKKLLLDRFSRQCNCIYYRAFYCLHFYIDAIVDFPCLLQQSWKPSPKYRYLAQIHNWFKRTSSGVPFNTFAISPWNFDMRTDSIIVQ